MSRPDPTSYKFDPNLHQHRYKPWLKSDERYIIENYGKVSLMELSLALERPYRAIQRRIFELKNQGLIKR